MRLTSYVELQTWLDRVNGEEPPPFRFKLERTSGSSRTPGETAQDARQAVGLGSLEPVCDLARLLEGNGVKLLLLKRKQDPLFGLSVGPGDRGPAVVVNASDGSSVEGWVFAAARELSHLLLHPSEYGRDSAEYSMQSELDADQFATEFLKADAGFARQWERTSGNSLLERVLKVNRIFGVSHRVVLLRLVVSGRRLRILDTKLTGSWLRVNVRSTTSWSVMEFGKLPRLYNSSQWANRIRRIFEAAMA